MERIEAFVELLCGSGVLLTPFYLIYKVAMYAIS